MLLNYQIDGAGEPLIILHGLFGSLTNWGTQAKLLANNFKVISVDLRNHGSSPHTTTMTYASMVEDIHTLMQHLQLAKANFLGHSMGGKVAMQLALSLPDYIDKLIVVDIAPVVYPAHHDDIFTGLFAIELDTIKSRSDADMQLSKWVPEPSVRTFLLKNLYRTKEGSFAWRMNLDTLYKQYAEINVAPEGKAYPKDVLFIKGDSSNYLIANYKESVLASFPKARYKIIKKSGHWPHAEQPAAFLDTVKDFLL